MDAGDSVTEAGCSAEKGKRMVEEKRDRREKWLWNKLEDVPF
jgi:hypothetical protein